MRITTSCATDLANADSLSFLPLAHRGADAPLSLEVLLLEMVPEAPLHAGGIGSLTQKDPVLSRVLHCGEAGGAFQAFYTTPQ